MDMGVFRWGRLRREVSKQELSSAIADGLLVWLRHGWYATDTADPNVRAAVEAGGVVACISALALHGVWTPPLDRVHIRGNHRAAREHPDWCRQYGGQPAEFEAVDDLLTALRHAARCLDEEDFIVVCDSIINLGLMTHEDLLAEFADRPKWFQKRLAKIDPRAESGIETMVRLRLRALGIELRSQVMIPMVGRVDFLVGTSLIIEVDGAEFHTSAQAHERDRFRDLSAHALGYHPVRLTYQQVVYEWHLVEPLILEMIEAGQHRQRVDLVAL